MTAADFTTLPTVDDLVTHRIPIEQAPYAYEIFQKKMDGCIKVVLEP
ncbi:MAG: hypothetical protein QOI56_302 [Actinomycetota bacterium]|nr:hypothetical protein [Actinomycetota bacterium]